MTMRSTLIHDSSPQQGVRASAHRPQPAAEPGRNQGGAMITTGPHSSLVSGHASPASAALSIVDVAAVAGRRMGLAGREAEVAAYITDERSDNAIALTLGIKHSTVRTNILRIKKKLEVHTRVGIAVAVMREVVRMMMEQETRRGSAIASDGNA